MSGHSRRADGVKARFRPGCSLVWLSSYPKSGNTWLRAMLAVLTEPDTPLDLGSLPFGMDLFDRGLLDDFAAIDSADMTADELIPYLAQLFAEASRSGDPPVFAKTHAAAVRSATGVPLFSPEACAGAIYLVRNPLDVAVSYAHHDARPLNTIIARMGDSTAALHHWEDRSSQNLPQPMGSWSEHVAGWTSDPGFPVLVLRYEDLLADTAAGLTRAARFCGLSDAPDDIDRAVQACRFDRLRAAEASVGFSEKPSSSRAFFRAGRSGDGRQELSRAQLEVLWADHGAIMRRFGYEVT